ncbi:MAG: STAS domain-containing protein, partial [Chloroflexi bacterium]|nr:STAS domain-containing protein [Chloroflexota bacterium]
LIAWLAATGLEKALAVAQHQAQEAEARSTELRAVSAQLQQTVDAQTLLLQVVQELEVPIIPLSPGTVALPLVGHVDTRRAQRIMQILLQSVSRYQARTVIIDLTGLGLLDSAVAQSLIQSAQGVQLLGARVIFSGLSAEMAQTMAHQRIRLPGQVVFDMQAALELVQREPGAS